MKEIGKKDFSTYVLDHSRELFKNNIKLEKIQKEIMLLQQEECDLEKSINQNKTLVYEIKMY